MKQPFHLFLIVSTVLSILIYSQYSDQEEGKIASNPSSLSTPKPSLHFLKSTSTRNLASSEKTEVYYFKRELSADLIQAVGSIEKPIFKMQYDGFFFIKELSENNFQTTIHFSENTLKQFPEEMKTANNLIPPFANFECDSNGKITSLKLKKIKDADSLKSETLAFYKQRDKLLIDLITQFVFNTDSDSNGHYFYTLTSLSDEHLKKIKTHYDEKSIQILQSEFNVIYQKHEKSLLNIQELKGEESLITGEFPAKIKQNLKVIFLKKVLSDLASQSGLPSKEWTQTTDSVSVTQYFKSTQKSESLPLLSKKPYKEIESKILEFKNNPNKLSSPERLELFRSLIQSLNENSENMDRFKALLSQNHSKDFLKFGIGALASLTHEKGQSALLEIYQNSETELPEKRMILTALTVTDTPSTASTQLLLLKEARESESTLRESALYALGAALKKETNPEKRIEINHFILETYLNSNDENLKRIAIDSMGNSGDKTFLPSLKKSLLSQNSEDRERAAFALRFMPPAESQTLLNLALKDTNENVRRSAEKAALIQTQKE